MNRSSGSAAGTRENMSRFKLSVPSTCVPDGGYAQFPAALYSAGGQSPMTGSYGRIDTAWPNKTWEIGGTTRMRRARTAMITTMMNPMNVSGLAAIPHQKPFAAAVRNLRRRVQDRKSV